MNQLDSTFNKLKSSGKCALMPYLMSHYPDKGTFRKLLLACRDAGADVIEVGVPFSDPIADGPTIQAAGQQALAKGASIESTLALLRDMRTQIGIPVVLMTYANLIFQQGIDRFFREASHAGIAGVVVPDIVLEESHLFSASARRYGISHIQFVSPTTPAKRLKDIAREAEGFIYLISVTGVTGARPGTSFSLKKYVDSIRRLTDTPVCVGFGIAAPAQAAAVSRFADGAIIGSAIIEIIKRHKTKTPKAVGSFLNNVRKAIDA